MSRISLIGVLVCFILCYPAHASAQTHCRFVFGFAELAARLGPETVGACLENQRTITGQESFPLAGGVTVTLPAGTAVQQTTTGVFTWDPDFNLTEFRYGNGTWTLTANGVELTTWEELTGQAPKPAPAAPSQASSAQNRASSRCFNLVSTVLISSVHASAAERERAKAEADALMYLCGQAADRDGMRGVDCFSQAWDAARGMERMFAGSGQRVYQEKYAACIGR